MTLGRKYARRGACHAGALVHGNSGTLGSQQATLRNAGVKVHVSIDSLVADVTRAVSHRST